MAENNLSQSLDQLREEVERLSKENEVIFDLLLKYRMISTNFLNNCICGQKDNSFVVNTLEEEYEVISNERHHSMSGESIDSSVEITSNTSKTFVENNDQNLNKCQSNQNKCTEDMDTDCQIIDEIYRSKSDNSKETMHLYSVYLMFIIKLT